MHADQQSKKRRTLLLLVLFFSVIMLFDALMIFNRQEPQTYQSKAQETSAGQIDRSTTIANYIDSLELSSEEHAEFIGGLALRVGENAEDLRKTRSDLNQAIVEDDLTDAFFSMYRLNNALEDARVNISATSALIDYYTATASPTPAPNTGNGRVQGAMIAQAGASSAVNADTGTIQRIDNYVSDLESKITAINENQFIENKTTILGNITTVNNLLQSSIDANNYCSNIEQAALLFETTKASFNQFVEQRAAAIQAYNNLTAEIAGLSILVPPVKLPDNKIKEINGKKFSEKINEYDQQPYADFIDPVKYTKTKGNPYIWHQLSNLEQPVKTALSSCRDGLVEQLNKLIADITAIKTNLNNDKTSPVAIAREATAALAGPLLTITNINGRLSSTASEITQTTIQDLLYQAEGVLRIVNDQTSKVKDELARLDQYDNTIKDAVKKKEAIKTKGSTDTNVTTKTTELETLLNEVDGLMKTNSDAVKATNKKITELADQIEALIKRLREILNAIEEAQRKRSNSKICEVYKPPTKGPKAGELITCLGLPEGSSCIYYGPTPTNAPFNPKDQEKEKYQCKIVGTTKVDWASLGYITFTNIRLGLGERPKNVCSCVSSNLLKTAYRTAKIWAKNNPFRIIAGLGAAVKYGEQGLGAIGGGDGGSGGGNPTGRY